MNNNNDKKKIILESNREELRFILVFFPFCHYLWNYLRILEFNQVVLSK